MEEIEETERYSRVIEYLRASVERLVNAKLGEQKKNHSISAAYVSSRLVDVLKASLMSEREQYLGQLITKLARMQENRANLEKELLIVKGSAERDIDRYTEENEQLRQQFIGLEDELKQIEWRQSTKETQLKERLQKKQEELRHLRKVVEIAQTTQETLSVELKELRHCALKMQKTQKRYIQKAKELCTQKLQETLEIQDAQQKTEENDHLSKLSEALKSEKSKQRRNERLCQSLLNSIWEMGNPEVSHPDITPSNFAQKIDELKAYIDETIEYHRVKAVKELKSEVNKAIPDLEIGEENIYDAVQGHIHKKIKEKEEEYKSVLEEGHKREKRLKAKLADALKKINQMQPAVNDSDELDAVDDFDAMRREWDEQKRILDEKMRILSQDKGKNETTTLTEIVLKSSTQVHSDSD